MSRATRYIVNAIMLGVLAFLFFRSDPFFAATMARRSFGILSSELQLAVIGAFLLVFAILGGRWLLFVLLSFCLIFFLPEISYPDWDDAIWQAASSWVGSSRASAISPVYATMHRLGSLAVYAVGLALLLWILSSVWRSLSQRRTEPKVTQEHAAPEVTTGRKVVPLRPRQEQTPERRDGTFRSRPPRT
jgi:hypothetical protein